MKLLEEAGLFGKGLVEISTAHMVNRYNACLEDIGTEPTALDKFSIDGIGWSPEIAAEKKDNFYLSHGGANQFAIILTPRQQNKPVYFPFYSFSRNLMNDFFMRFMRQIADITRDSGMWLDIDQDISHYLGPLDLLLVDVIRVQVYTPGKIMEAALGQRKLVQRFMNDETAWFDAEFRKTIIDSAKKYGDLRFRSVIIPEFSYADTRSFYTMAFDGLWLFRDILRKESHLLILENGELLKEMGKEVKGVYALSDSRLFTAMIFEGLTGISTFSYYQKHPDTLEIKLECILADTLAREYPEVRLHELTVGQRKGYIRKLQTALPPEYCEMERLIKHFRQGISSSFNRLSSGLTRMLMYPNPSLPEKVQHIIWQLITEIEPLDLLHLYVYNRSRFFALWHDWPEGKQAWAVHLLGKHYPHFRK